MPPKLATLLAVALLTATTTIAQTTIQRQIAVLGSSTSAGYGSTTRDSSWVGRLNSYYKYQLHAVDTVYNLAQSGANAYQAMPSSYVPPPERSAPEPARNVTRALSLLKDLPVSSNGVIIVNFPTNGYETYTVPEVMNCLQTIYDSATRLGNRCFVTTTQPRSDGSFASPASRRKLADIKDSIIARFGSNSINFWDGMFNPADSSILPIYSYGDNIHLNNTGHNVIFNRVVGKLYSLPYTPAAGDYRSNVATGLWEDPASWKRFDGSNWVTATLAPSGTDGLITIRAGDSIHLRSACIIDELVIETGAILNTSNTTATTYLLNDGPGHDILNYGRLYVAANALVTGNGTLQNGATGQLYLQNNGTVQVNIVNDGFADVKAMGVLQNNTFINNKTMVVENQQLNLNGALLVNNDSISLTSSSSAGFGSSSTGYLVNSTSAVMHKQSSSGVATFAAAVSFSNSGNLKGSGEYMISNASSNIGNIRPSGAAILRLNSAFISGRSPVIQLDIINSGAVAGTNYSQVLIPSGTTNLSAVKLVVTNGANDPLGTTYTLISSPAGTLTGSFASIRLPAGFGNLTYTANAVTVQKLAIIVLPLTWGDFNVTPRNSDAYLQWSTLQENNTDHFDIEYSTDGRQFIPAGKVTGAGTSYSRKSYEFLHRLPDNAMIVYYRLKQVDADGRYVYSAVRQIWPGRITQLKVLRNPVNDILYIAAPESGILQVADLNGKVLLNAMIKSGINTYTVSEWSGGIYIATVRMGAQQKVWKIVKE